MGLVKWVGVAAVASAVADAAAGLAGLRVMAEMGSKQWKHYSMTFCFRFSFLRCAKLARITNGGFSHQLIWCIEDVRLKIDSTSRSGYVSLRAVCVYYLTVGILQIPSLN